MFWCFFYGYNSNDSHDTYVPKCFIQNTKHFVTLCLLCLLLERVGDKPVCDNHRCSKVYIQHRSKGISTFLCSFVALEFCTNEISRLMSWSRLLCSCVWIILSENKKHFMFGLFHFNIVEDFCELVPKLMIIQISVCRWRFMSSLFSLQIIFSSKETKWRSSYDTCCRCCSSETPIFIDIFMGNEDNSSERFLAANSWCHHLTGATLWMVRVDTSAPSLKQHCTFKVSRKLWVTSQWLRPLLGSRLDVVLASCHCSYF